MNDLIEKAAQDIATANRVTALTGAGISVESGIPPFRGSGASMPTRRTLILFPPFTT
jgi:NAD-dependent SIR2 family protein deacetylase